MLFECERLCELENEDGVVVGHTHWDVVTIIYRDGKLFIHLPPILSEPERIGKENSIVVISPGFNVTVVSEKQTPWDELEKF